MMRPALPVASSHGAQHSALADHPAGTGSSGVQRTPIYGSDGIPMPFAISCAGRGKPGDLLKESHRLQPCETQSEGIAEMGRKSVAYAAAGAPEVRCSFNFTDNKPLSEAADSVMAIANTLQAGIELDRLHRYDRLGLDAAMQRLVRDVKEGRAVEIVAIRPALQRLVERSCDGASPDASGTASATGKDCTIATARGTGRPGSPEAMLPRATKVRPAMP